MEEAVDPTLRLRGPQVGEQAERVVHHPLARGTVQRGGRQQVAQDVGFGGAVKLAHAGTGGGEIGHGILESAEFALNACFPSECACYLGGVPR
jgi:hypothetical protein